MATTVSLLHRPFAPLYDVCVGHKFLPAFQSGSRFAADRFGLPVNLYARRGLLLYPQNRVLYSLGNTKFDDRLRWNLDLLMRLGSRPCALSSSASQVCQNRAIQIRQSF
jgi:hypothetical protein